MQPMGQQQLMEAAKAGVPGAIEQLKMMGIELPPQAPPQAAPGGPQSSMWMGPMGGGLVPPGRPQGLSAGDPSAVPNSIPIMQQLAEALRRR